MIEKQRQRPSLSDEARKKSAACAKRWREANKELVAAKAKEKYAEKRDEILAKKAEYFKANKQKIAEYQRKHYLENRDAIIAKEAARRGSERPERAEWQREYRKANPELARQRDREYYQKDREKKLKQKSEWGKTPEGKIKQKAKNHARRARKNSVVSTLAASDLKEIRDKAKGRCFYCRVKGPLALDHIIPICKGGPHSRDNVVMACRSCNSSKGPKDPMKFARERGLLLI